MENIGIIRVISRMDIPIGQILGLYWGYIGVMSFGGLLFSQRA